MVYLKDSRIPVNSPEEVAKVFQDLLLLEDGIDREKEHYYVMHLDTRNRVMMVELVAIGVLNSAVVHPRETFRRAVSTGAYAIIIGHNHPSQSVDPSDEDIRTTKLMFEAGKLLGIALHDHIIFSSDHYFSFTENRTGRVGEQRRGGEHDA